MSEPIVKRIFIGGIAESVTADELSQRFSHFGNVSNVTLKTRTDEEGVAYKSFAHLDLKADEASVKKCFATYQNAKWKGSVMKLEYAKESFIDKLKKERDESAQELNNNNGSVDEVIKAPERHHEVVATAKGVPGTPVPGKKDWVVGKYGRALPVLKLKKSYKIPMVKHDPSKYCHAAKEFKEENENTRKPCEKLTWEIDQPDSEITKKRKGEFPESPSKPKKKILSTALKPSTSSLEPSNRKDHYATNGVGAKQSHSSPMNISREEDKLEIVKSGVPMRKSKGSTSALSVSNKFDSDIDSDSEDVNYSLPGKMGQQTKQAKPAGGDKKKVESRSITHSTAKPNVTVESRSITHSTAEPNVTEYEDQPYVGSSMLKSKGILNKSLVNGHEITNREIPEFKGLSMLSDFDMEECMAGKGKGDEVKGHTPTSDKNPIRRKQVVKDISPAEFLTSKQTLSLPQESHKASDKQVQSVQNSIKFDPKLRDQEVLPEFKGLGMLEGFDIEEKKQSNSNTDSSKQGLSLKKPNTQSVLLAPSKLNPPQKHVDKPETCSSTPKNSLKRKSKCETGQKLNEREASSGTTSDSSTGTDEILLRHKTKRSNVISPETTLTNREPVAQTKGSPSKELVSKSNSLYLSEFESGVPEEGREMSANKRISRERDSSDEDSYDSDLDSNDFALVAKKLRQQQYQREVKTKRGSETDKQHQREQSDAKSKTKQVETKTLTKDSKKGADGSEKVSDLQSKLLNIAGQQEIKAAVSKFDSPLVVQQEYKQLSDKEKRQIANQKRLEAMKEQAKVREQQLQVMKDALKNIDSAKENANRIVFDSSSDDDGDAEKPRLDDGSTPRDEAAVVSNIVQKSVSNRDVKNKSGPTLFDSSSDEESDENDYEEMFKSKPQFEGKKGEKLLKLEKSFGDNRFKLDAKFADSDSDADERGENKDDGEQTMDTSVSNAEDLSASLKEEKSSSLKVLENIIGKSTLDRFTEKINKNTKKIIDMNTVRFDPTKMTLPASPLPDKLTSAQNKKKESAKVLVVSPQNEKDNKLQKDTDFTSEVREKKTVKFESEHSSDSNDDEKTSGKKKKKDPKLKDPLVKNETKQSRVEVSNTLVDLFKPKDGPQQKSGGDETAFSLLEQFGHVDTDDEDGHVKTTSSKLFKFEKTKSKEEASKLSEKNVVKAGSINASSSDEGVLKNVDEKKKSTLQHPKMDLSDDDDDDDDEGEENEEQMDTDISSRICISTEDGVDAEMIEAGRVNVRFTKEEWSDQWDTLRQSIIKIYKRKHRDALKKKRIHGENKRKKEFLKNSRKPGKKHWGAFKKR